MLLTAYFLPLRIRRIFNIALNADKVLIVFPEFIAKQTKTFVQILFPKQSFFINDWIFFKIQ